MCRDESRFRRNHTPNSKNNPLHSIFGRYTLNFSGTSYRRREKYLRLAITISFPTTVHSLSRFRPSDRRNWHRQRYIFFSQFCRFGYKTLLLIDAFFFCSVGLDLIRFCYGFLDFCFLNFRYLLLFCFLVFFFKDYRNH